MFHEKAQRVELEVLDKLCCYLDCDVSDILEPTYNREVDVEGNVVWEKVFLNPLTNKNKK